MIRTTAMPLHATSPDAAVPNSDEAFAWFLARLAFDQEFDAWADGRDRLLAEALLPSIARARAVGDAEQMLAAIREFAGARATKLDRKAGFIRRFIRGEARMTTREEYDAVLDAVADRNVAFAR